MAVGAISRTRIVPLSAYIPDVDFTAYQRRFLRSRSTDSFKTLSRLNLL